MSTKATGASGPGSRPNRRPTQRPGGKTSRPGAPSSRARRTPPRSDFKILDKSRDKGKTEAPVAIVDGLYRGAYEGLPGVVLQRIDGSYHFVMIDQPEAFAKALDTFLAGS